MNDKNIQEFPFRDFSHAIEVLDEETTRIAQQRHREGISSPFFPALKAMIRDFSRCYYKEGQRRQGIRGLFLSVHRGMIPFLIYAKHWELRKKHSTHIPS